MKNGGREGKYYSIVLADLLQKRGEKSMDLTKGVPVSIHLKTEVNQNDEWEEFLFDVKGQVIKMGETLYIRYKEEQEDNSEPVSVTIKIFPDGAIQLVRTGEMRTRLKFVYGQKFETSYKTPYGTIFFSTYTKDLHFSLTDQPTAGKITIAYDLSMPDQKIGSYHLLLEFSA